MAVFSTEIRLLLARSMKYLLVLEVIFFIFFVLIVPLIQDNPEQITRNFYQNIGIYTIIFLISFVAYKKLPEDKDDAGRKSGEILAPVCIVGFFFMIIAGSLGLIGSGKEIAKTADIVPVETPLDLKNSVDISALQEKYGMYGSCSEITRWSLEISQTDALYRCSDPQIGGQLGNRNCFFNGHYIDGQARYDLASLSTGICAREEAKNQTNGN